MKTQFISLRHGLKIVPFSLLISIALHAQTYLPTGTITGYNNYTNTQGVIVPPGNTVTVAPGAVVQFNYGLTIDSNAVLINQGDTIKMGNGQRIYLVQAQANDTSHHGGKLILDNNSVITSLSSSVNGALWQGIECLGSGLAGGINHSALLQIDNGTIQYANCAYTHYDPALGFFGGAGRIYAQNATFRNNIRCLDVGSTWYMPTSNPDSIAWIGNYVENSSFLLTADFPYTPPDMIYEYGAGLICHSCTFHADYYYGTLPNLTYNYSFANNTTAIKAQLSIIWLEQAIGNTSGCLFEGLKNGLVGGPNLSYESIVSNSYFDCVNAINIDGSNNPLLIGNWSYGPWATNSPVDYCSIFLRNCPLYRVEHNRINYDIAAYDTNFFGIVVMDCDSNNNEVYRNSLDGFSGIGIESIGTNRSSSGDSGLKILCNHTLVTNYNIAIMQDTLPNSTNGINNLQYVQGANPMLDASAANTFENLNQTNPYRNYFLDANTNDTSQFLYKYNSSTSYENPVYRTPFNAVTTNANTCPVVNTRPPQSPLPMLLPKGGGRILSTMRRPPSGKPGGNQAPISKETLDQMSNMDAARYVEDQLAKNNYDWSALPYFQKKCIYDVAQNEPGYPGSIARGLLSRYEGKEYDPVLLAPKSRLKPKESLITETGKIYPNPTDSRVTIIWAGDKAIFTLTDVLGKTILQQWIKEGNTEIDLSGVAPGAYFAAIKRGGKILYQQKLVKR